MFPPLLEDLLEQARGRLGLNDFGNALFLDGLTALLGSLGAETEISILGRRSIKGALVNGLENRLLIRETMRQRPAVAESPVRRPLFIVGLSRTGTTFLHNLLALADDARAPRAWEVQKPAPPCAPGSRDEKRRTMRTARLLWLLQAIAPDLRTVHPIKAEDYEECYPLVNNTFTSPAFSFHYGLPGYTAWLAGLDAGTERWVYGEYREQLQILQAGRPRKRWILKSAVHLFFLRALLEEFPDACVVQTHRDPLRTIPSLCSMVLCFRRVVYARAANETLGRELLEKSRTALERGRAARREFAEGRVLDVQFDELVADPIGQVRRIHDAFDLGWNGEFERRMKRWIGSSSTGRHPDHRYSMAEFGLDEDMILSSLDRGESIPAASGYSSGAT